MDEYMVKTIWHVEWIAELQEGTLSDTEVLFAYDSTDAVAQFCAIEDIPEGATIISVDKADL